VVLGKNGERNAGLLKQETSADFEQIRVSRKATKLSAKKFHCCTLCILTTRFSKVSDNCSFAK